MRLALDLVAKIEDYGGLEVHTFKFTDAQVALQSNASHIQQLRATNDDR